MKLDVKELCILYLVKDSKRHAKYNKDCKCNPEVYYKDKVLMIVHTSYDGRESMEEMLYELNIDYSKTWKTEFIEVIKPEY